MIKKFLNWKGGLIVGATTAILIAAIASPIVGKNAVTASYNKKLSLRTGDEKAQSVQKFTITEDDFKAAVANLQLKDQYKNKLTASTALELHNDKSYSFELIDAVDLSALKAKDSEMEFELRTISKTEDASNPSVATKDGVINNIYVIGIDTKNNIYFHATGSISGFLPDAQADANNNYFVDGAQSSIKIKDAVQDKTATAVALELQKLFSSQIQSPTPKSGETTAPVAPKAPAKPADSTGSTTTPAKPVESPKAPATTSYEGRRPKQADGQTAASTTSTTSGTPLPKLAQAFKAALSQIGGFNLKDTNGDFTFLPDSYYIAPVVDANNKLKFSNVNNINETLSIDVEIIGPDGTKLPTTLDFANLGNTSQTTQDELIKSFANSYKLKPGIAKALGAAHLGIADVVYASSLPTALANVAPFNTQGANVKDFGFWFEKTKTQKFGATLDSSLSGFTINIAQGDAAPSAEEIESLKATDSLKLSIQYQQQEGSSSIPQGINVDTAKTFQAGTNLILDTRGETIDQLIADSLPKLAESVYVTKDATGSTKAELNLVESDKDNTQKTQFVDANLTKVAAPQGTKEASKPQIASKLSFDIDLKAPILFANHLDTAIAAFNASSASNINLAVSQLAFLLDRSGNDAKLDEKTYGQYIKDTLTTFNSELPKGVTLALKGQFDKQTSKYTVYVKAMAGSKELKAYSFDITNVSAPNYAYDAASKFGADVFVDATFDRLVKSNVQQYGKVIESSLKNQYGKITLSTLLNYNNPKQRFINIKEGNIQASQEGVALKNDKEAFHLFDNSDATLKNGTLWFAFKASKLQKGIRTYFLGSKEQGTLSNGHVRLFIEKVPTVTKTIQTEPGVEAIHKDGYVIGISYDKVKGFNDNAEVSSGDIVALFASPSKSTIKKDNNQVFQLLTGADHTAKQGNEYNQSTFENKYLGNLDYSDFISKKNNEDPTLLLEINISNPDDKSKDTKVENKINFVLYSSAVKDPLNNPIISTFTQPTYVEGTPNQGKKAEGAQNQGKKAEGAQNQGKKTEEAKATSFINRGIDFTNIGDLSFGSDTNYITFKALGVFKDNGSYTPTQNSEVRRQIAKAFIDQYFTEDKDVAKPTTPPAAITTEVHTEKTVKGSQGAKQVKAAPAGAAIQSR